MEEDYAMASRRETVFSWLLPIVCMLFMLDTFLYHLVNFNMLPLEYVLLKLSYICLLSTSVVVFFVTLRYRKEMSQIIRFTNQTSADILQMDNNTELRLLRNRFYLGIVVFHLFISILATLALMQYAIEPIFYGRLFLGTFRPFKVVPFPVEALAEFAILFCTLFYCANFAVFFFEPILIFATTFRGIAEKLQQLRTATKGTAQEDIDQFKAILAKLEETIRYPPCLPNFLRI